VTAGGGRGRLSWRMGYGWRREGEPDDEPLPPVAEMSDKAFLMWYARACAACGERADARRWGRSGLVCIRCWRGGA
jgi:hypothetical protein